MVSFMRRIVACLSRGLVGCFAGSPEVGFTDRFVAGAQNETSLPSRQRFFGDCPCDLRLGAVRHLVFFGEGRPLRIAPEDRIAIDLDLKSGFLAVAVCHLLAELVRLRETQARVQFADDDGGAVVFRFAGFS